MFIIPMPRRVAGDIHGGKTGRGVGDFQARFNRVRPARPIFSFICETWFAVPYAASFPAIPRSTAYPPRLYGR